MTFLRVAKVRFFKRGATITYWSSTPTNVPPDAVQQLRQSARQLRKKA